MVDILLGRCGCRTSDANAGSSSLVAFRRYYRIVAVLAAGWHCGMLVVLAQSSVAIQLGIVAVMAFVEGGKGDAWP